ncbi:MAG: NAD(P)H-hydrate dehydratase [Lachnospiraceae bacterium]|nr:NAD(P)H-hydrate dehydratase [Lachnospiraceae bacterium]
MPTAKLCFPKKPSDADKIKYGKTLVIAGSKNVYGAAFFAAKSALMSGAGMVRIVSHIRNRIPLTRDIPEAMYSFYGMRVPKLSVKSSLKWADTVVVGPGISVGKSAHRLMELTLKYIKRDAILILDADALNVLSRSKKLLSTLTDLTVSRNINCVITPHKGELSRLKKAFKIVDLDDDGAALHIYNTYRIYVVRKGGPTLTFGEDIFLNTTGNEGMATAGSGDVLSGILGGILFRTKDSPLSLGIALGVFIHGLAGDLAAQNMNSISVNATDIMRQIPSACTMIEKYGEDA